MNITLIVKGDIRHRRRLSGQVSALQSRLTGSRVTISESGYPGQAVALAAAACERSDCLVAVGGDGTLNEVLNGCMRARASRPDLPLPVIGVLARGTANDFIRSIGLQGSTDELCSLLQSGATRTIDVGRLRCRDAAGESLERYFFNVADVGIGARVVERLGVTGKNLGSNLSYLRAIISSFFSYRHVQLELRSDGGLEWRGRSLLLVAANGRYFGSALCVAPDARLDDGRLSFTLVGNAGIFDFLKNYGRLKKGLPLDHPEALYHSAGNLSVDSPGPPAPVEADGEFMGYTPAFIEVLPGEIRFLAPSREEE